MAVFLHFLHRWESAELNQEEAAELLGRASGRFGGGRAATRRRARPGFGPQAWQGVGQAGSGRPGRGGGRPYRERYQGFTVKHFHEHLVKDHGFGWGYTWTSFIFSGWGWSGSRRARGRTGASASGGRCRG